MAVLVEGISVVIHMKRLLSAVAYDWEKFVSVVPNSTLCADEELVRVGFMHPDDVKSFVHVLMGLGLPFSETLPSDSLIVVDQLRGFTTGCDWARFGHINLDGDQSRRVAACMLAGSAARKIALPFDWTFEDSLSRSFAFTPQEHINLNKKICDEEGLQSWTVPICNKIYYMGRTSRDIVNSCPTKG